MTWRWLMEGVVVAMHDELIAEHGGILGIRDADLLSSALTGPQNPAADGDPSVFDLAPAYAYGIIGNHPFADGNKRTGFLAAFAFLDLHGWELTASEAEAAAAVLDLAAGKMDETGFSDWLKSNSTAGTEQE
jgi:death on curing protein